jgi:hypothetical protein
MPAGTVNQKQNGPVSHAREFHADSLILVKQKRNNASCRHFTGSGLFIINLGNI